MRKSLIVAGAVLSHLLLLGAARAEEFTVVREDVTAWKAVYGRVEARDRVPARARIGGTLVALDVSEGDHVTAGQLIARVIDDKLGFQLGAIDAQLQALGSQLDNAQAELTRGEELLARGVTTVQRLDALRTQVDVLRNQIDAAKAQRHIVAQQAEEGAVLAPATGLVLDVPVTAGAVLMPGEQVAMIGGGGVFLRLALPERHAGALAEGDAISIATTDGDKTGRLARIYPQIENGRVIADVEAPGINGDFVDARLLVRLPVGQRAALLLPAAAVHHAGGLDMVRVSTAAGVVERVVTPGELHLKDGVQYIEIMSGLSAGDSVVTDHD